MAQSASAAYKAMAVAQTRSPLAKVEIEWDPAGAPGVWTDESAYLIETSGESQVSAKKAGPSAIGPGTADSLSVTLRNTDGHFNGQDYDGFGKRIRVNIGFAVPGAEYLPQFIGYLQEPDVTALPAVIRFSALDYAAKAVAQRGSTPIFVDLRSDQYLSALAALLNPAVTWDTDHPHPGSIQINYAWLDNEQIWEDMQTVVEAEGGRLYFAKGTGLLRFEPYSDLLIASQTPVATLTTANFANLHRKHDWQNAKNHVQVSYRSRYAGGEQVVWQSADSIRLLPGGQEDVVAQLDVPVLDDTLITPVPGTDFTARSAAYGVHTGDVAAAIIGTPTAQHATVRLANANTDKARYVDGLRLRGVPVLSGPQRMAESIDSSYDAVYGRSVLPFDNVFVQDTPTGAAIGQMLRDRYSPPRRVFTVADSPGLPWLELGDLVTVTDRFGASVDGYLAGISWSWKQGYRASYTIVESASLAPHDPGEYFIVGISGLGDGLAWY